MRSCTNWQIYADDITVRSGRWMDGVYYSDEERSQRVKDAAEREEMARIELEESFRALGFDPSALGAEKVPQKTRSARKGSSSSLGRRQQGKRLKRTSAAKAPGVRLL